MPNIKCLSCRWHLEPTGNCPQGSCYSRRVTGGNRQVLPLDTAREVCNKEGDGIFVYFEPILGSPPYKGGVAAVSADGVVLSSSAAAGGAR